jgi:hypothetical protein
MRLNKFLLEEISELRMEAAASREFAATFSDKNIIADLENYASALEAQVAELEVQQRLT